MALKRIGYAKVFHNVVEGERHRKRLAHRRGIKPKPEPKKGETRGRSGVEAEDPD